MEAPTDFTRFEIELEFVQCLANPLYLNYLAQAKYLEDEQFIKYIEYLEYFRKPEYIKFLTYPAYSLNALSMLKQPRFRSDILSLELAQQMMNDALGITPPVQAAEEQKTNGENAESQQQPQNSEAK